MKRNNIHEHGNRKTNESHKFVLNFSQRLDLRRSDKLIHLLHVEKYKKTLKNDKLEIIAPKWNVSLNYQIVLVQFQIFMIILNLSLQSMKH